MGSAWPAEMHEQRKHSRHSRWLGSKFLFGELIFSWFFFIFPVFISGSILFPVRVSVPFSSHILLTWFCFMCPESMSRDALYPVDSSSYTSWDGNTYHVSCTIPGAAAVLENDPVYSCPGGFVPPREDSDPRNCIKVISLPDSIFFQIYLCLTLALPFLFSRIFHYCHSRVPSMRIRQKSTLSCGSSRRSYLL